MVTFSMVRVFAVVKVACPQPQTSSAAATQTGLTSVPRLTGERWSSKTHRLTASEDKTKSRSATGLPESCALAPAHRHHRTLTLGYIIQSKALVLSICQPNGVAQHRDPERQLQAPQCRQRLHSRAGPCRPERSETLVLRDTRRTSLFIRSTQAWSPVSEGITHASDLKGSTERAR